MAVSKSENKELLELFANLRVADVRDGMDTLMLHNVGSMAPTIRPLFRTRALGIARTCRYLAYDGTLPKISPEEYWDWAYRYYDEVCSYPWMGDIEEGDFIVIDQSSICSGLMGSNNSLDCIKSGARGLVTNGGVRDTDEVILEQIPFWSESIAQTMVQNRLKYDAKNIPVSVGGATVYPGDVIVADGDGVIVVPRVKAPKVAEYAHAEHKRDIKGRRSLYEALKMKVDKSVKEYD